MSDLYIDIETCPDLTPGALERCIAGVEPPGQYKKPESIAEWKAQNAAVAGKHQWLRTALDPMCGGVYVIGYSYTSGGDRESGCFSRDPRTESETGFLDRALDHIASLVYAVGQPGSPRWIGWNHIGFDIPFLAKRCVLLGIKPALALPIGHRYNGDRVLDLMQSWGGGPREYVKQAEVARAMGMPEVQPDGAGLWEAVEAGGIEVAAAKCAADIAQLVDIHRRMSAVYMLAAA